MNTKTNAEFNVLIIDDEEEIREGSHRILTRAGYPAYTAANGQEGLDILSREAMSIVLLDLKMPGIDGMDVLKLLQESYPHILVIIITGFATVETAIEAMKKGAYDFIPKPFEPDQLRLVVNRARDTISLTRETEALELERQRNLKDLNTEKSRLHTIVDSLPNGVVVTNSLGEAVLLNQAFINHLGLPPETESGGHITEYVADEGLCDLILDI
ncbi:MAG: response regulator, partial [Desulfohalobiaceae bacterium]|nr:response regulator [Desulfohalobiaceae bacterium]